ncbi:MAG: toxin-antitoxin system YwqK family antitoxin [Aureispira sp.]
MYLFSVLLHNILACTCFLFLLLHTSCSTPETSTSILIEKKKLDNDDTINIIVQIPDSLFQDTIYNQYQNGNKEGFWRVFDQQNQLVSEEYYHNGKINGWVKWYYEGQLVAFGQMKDDKREGWWKICDVHEPTQCIRANFETDKKISWQALPINKSLSPQQNNSCDNSKTMKQRLPLVPYTNKNNQISKF